MTGSRPREDVFQLLTATYTRRLLQGMRDPCAEAEDDPFSIASGPEIVLSATAARTVGRSLIFAADGAVAAPDWLVLCETRAAGDGAVADFGFAARLPGKAEPRAFVSRAYVVLFARLPDPIGLEGYAGALTRGEKTRADILGLLLASPEALARRWRFALLPLDGELSAVFGADGFDDLAPPRFVVED